MLCVFVFRFLMIVYLMCVLFFTLLWAYNKDDDDNTGITQSQAHDTGYRRMQELNRLCVSK